MCVEKNRVISSVFFFFLFLHIVTYQIAVERLSGIYIIKIFGYFCVRKIVSRVCVLWTYVGFMSQQLSTADPLGVGNTPRMLFFPIFYFIFSLFQLFSRSIHLLYETSCVDFTQCGVPSRHDWHKSYVTLKHGAGVVIY